MNDALINLHNRDVEEAAAEANGDGGRGHDGGAGKKPHGHGEGRHRVTAGDYLRLKGHEQTC